VKGAEQTAFHCRVRRAGWRYLLGRKSEACIRAISWSGCHPWRGNPRAVDPGACPEVHVAPMLWWSIASHVDL
jgi:hypothetical protein